MERARDATTTCAEAQRDLSTGAHGDDDIPLGGRDRHHR